jgi:hypothetical protein
VAGKPGRPEKPEPAPVGKDQSFGEALEEMGFLPVPGAKRRIIREGPPSKPLTRWNKPKEQG